MRNSYQECILRSVIKTNEKMNLMQKYSQTTSKTFCFFFKFGFKDKTLW